MWNKVLYKLDAAWEFDSLFFFSSFSSDLRGKERQAEPVVLTNKKLYVVPDVENS